RVGLRGLAPECQWQAAGRAVLGAALARRADVDAPALGRGEARAPSAAVHGAGRSGTHGASRGRSLPRRPRRGTRAGGRALAIAGLPREARRAVGPGGRSHQDRTVGRPEEGAAQPPAPGGRRRAGAKSPVLRAQSLRGTTSVPRRGCPSIWPSRPPPPATTVSRWTPAGTRKRASWNSAGSDIQDRRSGWFT